MTYLKTSDIAKAAGVHPNTVRNYEKWNFISPVPRKKNGYRIFNEVHLNQVILVTMAFRSTWLGGEIRDVAMKMISYTASLKLDKALLEAEMHLELILREKHQAKEALNSLEYYAQHGYFHASDISLSTKEVSELLSISVYTLRDWERNGLLNVPRNPDNGYRIYGQEEIVRLKLIRLLRQARHSILSILRMFTSLERGKKSNFEDALRKKEDDDIFFATDSWISALDELQENAVHMIVHLIKMH